MVRVDYKMHPNGPQYLPGYGPPLIPDDIADELAALFQVPYWWIYGQMIQHLWRYQPAVRQDVHETRRSLQFEHPIVGVQVRRTDKNSEATYRPIEEYFEQVELFYRRYEATHEKSAGKRRVYLATDEPGVINETLQK